MPSASCDTGSRISAQSAASSLLSVRNLTVHYSCTDKTSPAALSGIDFTVNPGEIIGVLGESGSGKSTLALSILGLLPSSASISGSIVFQKNNLLQLQESEWRSLRGARIATVFQEPGLSLNPVMKVGDQIAEVARAHSKGKADFRQQVEALLAHVGLVEVERIYKAYPHQLSGGELHRIAIAQALVCRPEVVIADEPTRSLDGVRQAEILNLFREAHQKFKCAIVFITHNPGLLAGFADRVSVMYAGRIVEEGPVSQVFRQPLHPYTKGLLQLVPPSLQIPGRSAGQHLPALPGSLSDADRLSPGCAFASRCFARTEICKMEFPPQVMAKEKHRIYCFNYGN